MDSPFDHSKLGPMAMARFWLDILFSAHLSVSLWRNFIR